MKLAFQCNQDPDAMPLVDGERFCTRCQHPVVDFTHMSRKEVAAYHRAHPGTCGQYRTDHFEPEPIPLSELLSLKHAALVAGLTLGSIQVSAQTPPAAATEQRAAVPASDAVESEAAPSEKSDGIFGTCERPVTLTPAQRYVPPKRWYVSKRFPFLHHGRPRPIGRIVGGISF